MINEFMQDDTQFVLSYELLCLLRWLTEHDAERLKKIITKAISSGELIEEMKKVDKPDSLNEKHNIQYNIVDFLSLLESLLIESMSEQLDKKARQKNLMPAIGQIDSSICDTALVRFSLEKATKQMDFNPNINPREQLFKELLKRWKPDKSMLN
jgi:hypothetical protein